MTKSIAERLDRLDWSQNAEQIETRGYANTDAFLSGTECAGLIALYY